ncbi:MAG: glycosyltransferase family 4 protein, partial [Tepidisphaeraceae bacterium]
MPDRPLPTFAHVPTPGDHYSPATGSAAITVLHELTRRHELAGGRTELVVGRGTQGGYTLGRRVEYAFSPLPNRRRKLVDVGLGRIGMRRPFETALYAPASAALDERFDGAVFLHNAPGAVRLFKKERPAAQVCLYAHNQLFNTYGRAEVRRTVDAADRVICVSEFIASELASRLGRASDKVRVVHNGVDADRFRPDPLKRGADGIPVILFVGRVYEAKGPHLLLEAARKIYDPRKRRFKVRVVGSNGFADYLPLSAYEQELRKIAAPMGETVEFQKFLDRARIVDEYQSASIFCAPANWDDPCPLTVLEGIGCGLPSVVSRRGGIPEIGADAVLYFKPPNVDELAERLAYLVDDESAREAWGHRARARAEVMT